MGASYNYVVAQSVRQGVADQLWGSVTPFYAMIEVDDSELTEEDREFLKEWAKALQMPIEMLVLRIIEGRFSLLSMETLKMVSQQCEYLTPG